MGQPDDPQQGDADELQQVLAVVAAFDSALESGDVAAASRWCLEDVVFYGSGEGEECVGRANLADMFASVRSVAGPNLVSWSLTLGPYDVALRGDAARVTASGRFELVERGGTRSGRYLLTGVLLRTDDGWRWWCFHGSEPQPW